MSSRLTKSIKASLIAGLLVFLPAFLTIWLLWKLFLLVDGFLNETVRQFLWVVLKIQFFQTHDIPGLGFVAVVVILFMAGLIARNFIGKKIIGAANKLVARIPLANKIYNAIDQIAKAFLSGKREVFQKAVLIEYPHKGMYCIAFYTQDTQGPVQESLPVDVISVFLPSTPNPTTGFLLFVPKSDVIPLDMPVEEALKLIISGGAITSIPQVSISPPTPPVGLESSGKSRTVTSGSDPS
jgi:uncharacterized membrane protein